MNPESASHPQGPRQTEAPLGTEFVPWSGFGPLVPLSPPLCPASVYGSRKIAQVEAVLAGDVAGAVYSRLGHPNAEQLARACALLHRAAAAVVTSSGMAALGLVALALGEPGWPLAAAQYLYGHTVVLLEELARWGVPVLRFDPADEDSTGRMLKQRPGMVWVETISNPQLQVADVARLARLCRQHDALLVVDNTFASPFVCRPLELGAHLVVESVTKILSGHSDVMLGAVCTGEEALAEPLRRAGALWGWTASPWDCWLALRGLATAELRLRQACHNASRLAQLLRQAPCVRRVYYPGLPEDASHELAAAQFSPGLAGHMVTCTFAGGREQVQRFIDAAGLWVVPSLGDVHTTVSHPATSSHRQFSPEQRRAWGIEDGTLRFSVGIEPTDELLDRVRRGLEACVV